MSQTIAKKKKKNISLFSSSRFFSVYKYKILTCGNKTYWNFIIQSMEKLPVEIVHLIFDHLDIETIFFSIRPVCRSFRSIVQIYDRFDFHSMIISKPHFDVLCRFVPPSNIRSLTLYHNEQIPDQISRFLSRIRLRQLTRLHSINLYGIDEFQYNYLCKRIHFNLVQSFSIQMKKYDDRRRKTTANNLFRIVNQPNLRKVELKLNINRISDISWPMNCSIECLTISRDIKFDDLVQIFSCSPRLNRLEMKGNLVSINIDERIEYSFVQLKYLTIEYINVRLKEMEWFLLLIPSIIYFKLIGYISGSNGKRWEEFLQVNFSNLDQFEFNIRYDKQRTQTIEDIQEEIEFYRTPFWIEHKKWFVGLEILNQYFYKIYSISTGNQSEFDYKNMSILINDDTLIVRNLSESMIHLKTCTNEYIFQLMTNLFRKIKKLRLNFDGECPVNYLDNLQKIVNISELIELELISYSSHRENERSFCNLLKESSNLSSLIVNIPYYSVGIHSYFDRMIEILPRRINNLKIPLNNEKQIEMIFKRCPCLSIIQFYLHDTKLDQSMIIEQWFERKTMGSIIRRDFRLNTIWIGKKKDEDYVNSKRMKLTC